jgi:hypothetical protein
MLHFSPWRSDANLIILSSFCFLFDLSGRDEDENVLLLDGMMPNDHLLALSDHISPIELKSIFYREKVASLSCLLAFWMKVVS